MDVQQVLTTAAAEFARHGYEGVSMRDIAARAGTSATALHYHFGSKETLYREACDDAYSTYIDAVLGQLSEDGTVLSPETLACAMFDQWMSDPTTLLLTDRDAVEALITPERWMTSQHYPRVLNLIRDAHTTFLHRDVDDDVVFAFAALVFGYGSLIAIDYRATWTGYEPIAEPAGFRDRHRSALARFASRLWQL